MPKSMKLSSSILFLCLGAGFPLSVFAAMPTAGLPIEPATSDKELYNDVPEPTPRIAAWQSEDKLGTLERSKSIESGFGGVDASLTKLQLTQRQLIVRRGLCFAKRR